MADLITSNAVDAFMQAADAAGARTAIGAAPLASPTFTGTPAAPTATPGTNTTQIATTAFVTAAVAAVPGGGGGGGGGGGLLTGNTSNCNIVFEGDSNTDGSVANNWPSLLMATPTFSGKGTAYNYAVSGSSMAEVSARTASVTARAPAGAVTSAWLFLSIGTNDIGLAGVTSDTTDALTSYLTARRGEGFKIVLTTIPPRTTLPQANTESRRQEINAFIRRSALWDALIDVDQLMPNASDTADYSDGIHYTLPGRQMLARYVASLFSGYAEMPLPPSGGVTVGASDSNVPSNSILKGTARAFTAAQGFGTVDISSASPVAWNLDAAQVAEITLDSNKVLSNPTNKRPGFAYRLFIKQDSTGSRLVTWGSDFKWPGGTAPTLSTAADAVDVIDFTAVGSTLLGRAFGQNYSLGAGGGGSATVQILEEFTSDGALNGSAPDTTNLIGATWAGSASRSGGRGAVGSNEITHINIGVANFELEARLFPGISNHAAICFRRSASNTYLLARVDNAGGWSLARYEAGTGSFGFTEFASGSITSGGASGDLVRVVTNGNTVQLYINGTLRTTQSISQNAAETGVGFVSYAGASTTVDDFKVSF